jgi:hypothetical protein
LSDAGLEASLWRLTGLLARTLLTAVLGAVPFAALLARAPALHRILAEPRRRRQRQLSYPQQKAS